ncbi:MAG: chloride channel protein [Paraglaciecola sp.]|uniref:chloride channel protein n=1 Tax=Paraglaciecola sp. TaxID=1920173 RepID=UPI00273F7858|nr:chloride channel protein [Paraglaciecola sp.]MDP5030634.1 chloride channel protein [Paraglaciecola sp.]MDP5130286.1 chloride channel protein [Paraglaciecola sp.]
MTLAAFRQELAYPRTSIQLCILGIVGGVSAATLIILFRLCIEWLQLQYLSEVDHFAELSPIYRLAMPIIAAVAIIFIAYLTGFKHYRMGIPFVIHRIKYYFGQIPSRTTINQFLGGTIALASGFSVGREGPSVHLGAAGSSFFGQWLKLPYNSIRILSGCGIAAGISASFNTPFAAVIFVMEVVLREYKIHIFIPIMLAAACGSVMTRLVFGSTHELSFIQFTEFSHWIYLYLILCGIILGGLASVFNNLLMQVIRGFNRFNMIRRLLIAGVITGIVGFYLPEALGAHFNSADTLISNQQYSVLIAVLVAKFILTIVAIGLGIPGGIMGPVFVIGMLSGALLSSPLGLFMADSSELTGSFSLLGMAGLMAAVVHAPLAALSAVMELSFSPELILPAILVIVPAYVTSTQYLGNSSIFIRQLDYQKLPYTSSSVIESLQKTGVLAVMDKEFKLFKDAEKMHIMTFLEQAPTHPVIYCTDSSIDVQYSLVHFNVSLEKNSEALIYSKISGVGAQATLAEVYELLQSARDGAVYVYGRTHSDIIGVITWHKLRNYLHQASY